MKFICVAIIAVMLLPIVAEPQSCVVYRDYLHLDGSVIMPDEVLGVAISGDYAYVANSYEGLQIVDRRKVAR